MSNLLEEKIFHRGYTSDMYITNNLSCGLILKKYFFHKKTKSVLSNIKIEDIYNREIEGIRSLNSVHVDGVVTPNILEIDRKNLWYTQKYFKLTPFNRYLIKNSNFFYSNRKMFTLFYCLGEYLAKFHKQSGRLHGDLNRKNILFGQDFIFICDPFIFKEQTNEKYTLDLFRVINNFYPYNIFLRPFIRKRSKLIRFFLRGYFDHSDNFFNEKELRAGMIRHLQEIDVLMSDGIVGRIKYFLIHLLNKNLIRHLERDNLKWFYEI